MIVKIVPSIDSRGHPIAGTSKTKVKLFTLKPIHVTSRRKSKTLRHMYTRASIKGVHRRGDKKPHTPPPKTTSNPTTVWRCQFSLVEFCLAIAKSYHIHCYIIVPHSHAHHQHQHHPHCYYSSTITSKLNPSPPPNQDSAYSLNSRTRRSSSSQNPPRHPLSQNRLLRLSSAPLHPSVDLQPAPISIRQFSQNIGTPRARKLTHGT